MRKPNCSNVISEKKIWEIGIEFIRCVDKKLVEYNLVLAYIVYLLCKESKFSYKITKKMIFASCFNDIGKLSASSKKSTPEIETYLFLKYFSPVKDFAEIIINPKKNKYAKTLYFAKKYTTFLVEQNDAMQAYACLDRRDYDYKIFELQGKILKKYDVKQELNSVHYKTIVYSLISKMMFKQSESAELITMLSSLFEMYSSQTLFHSKTCAYIAYYLSLKMRQGREENAKVYVAGLCHDLGKVKVPRTILEKDGRLTDDEFKIMKSHVIYTRELLNHRAEFDIIEMASRHHEKIDGSGYPNKLDGDHMTQSQKIIQVADLISALTGKRSYKEAWTVDDVVKELTYCVNHNTIDKDVVNCFIKHKKKIMNISNMILNEAKKVYDKIDNERNMLIKKD